MSKKIIPFKQKKVSKKEEETILEKGSLGECDYVVYKRGNIHIFNEEYSFKKDCELFEKALDQLDLNSLKEGDTKKIPGSGDNDTLVFTCKDGDIMISLEKSEYSVINKLKELLQRGKKNV